jgi:hypothetical protein
MGGKIWVDLTARLEHVGLMTYRGDLAVRVDLPPEVSGRVEPEPPPGSGDAWKNVFGPSAFSPPAVQSSLAEPPPQSAI